MNEKKITTILLDSYYSRHTATHSLTHSLISVRYTHDDGSTAHRKPSTRLHPPDPHPSITNSTDVPGRTGSSTSIFLPPPIPTVCTSYIRCSLRCGCHWALHSCYRILWPQRHHLGPQIPHINALRTPITRVVIVRYGKNCYGRYNAYETRC